jgi:FKBP-type peptidyl-prolyl cis-trans isomerase
MKGIEIEELAAGSGDPVKRGDRVTIRTSTRLNRGDAVNEGVVSTFVVGSRTVITGLERGIEGMRAGGRRSLRISPHLAYGARGTDTIPPDAVLVMDVELLAIEPA